MLHVFYKHKKLQLYMWHCYSGWEAQSWENADIQKNKNKG